MTLLLTIRNLLSKFTSLEVDLKRTRRLLTICILKWSSCASTAIIVTFSFPLQSELIPFAAEDLAVAARRAAKSQQINYEDQCKIDEVVFIALASDLQIFGKQFIKTLYGGTQYSWITQKLNQSQTKTIS